MGWLTRRNSPQERKRLVFWILCQFEVQVFLEALRKSGVEGKLQVTSVSLETSDPTKGLFILPFCGSAPSLSDGVGIAAHYAQKIHPGVLPDRIWISPMPQQNIAKLPRKTRNLLLQSTAIKEAWDGPFHSPNPDHDVPAIAEMAFDCGIAHWQHFDGGSYPKKIFELAQ